MVTGLFRDRGSAERAFQGALDLGYEQSDINVLMSDETRERYFPSTAGKASSALEEKATTEADKPLQADELGGPVGGTVGTIAPVLAAVGTLLLVPGIVIAGPVAVALMAAGAVGIAGGVVGALTNWGIPKERVHRYEDDVRRGGILLGVEPRSDEEAERLQRRWRESGGQVQ